VRLADLRVCWRPACCWTEIGGAREQTRYVRGATRERAEGMNTLIACSETAPAPDGEPFISWNAVGGLYTEEDRIAWSPVTFFIRPDGPTLYLLSGDVLTIPNADFLA